MLTTTSPSLVYVTGVPGVGKSSVRRELRRLGHSAFGTDEDGIAAFFDRSDRAVPADEVVVSSAWRAEHTWRIIPARLDEIESASDGGRVFICGSAANEGDVWTRFAAVVALVVDETTLHLRLDGRTDNDFGTSPDERAKVVGWLRGYAESLRSSGAIVIDASPPIGEVAAALLAATADLNR